MVTTRRTLIALLLPIVASCAVISPPPPPEVRLADVELREGGLLEQRLGLVLRIRNVGNSDLSIDGLRLALDLNDLPFARGVSNERLIVPRLSEATMRAEASIDVLDLLRQLLALSDRESFTYKLSGVVFLPGAFSREVPFAQAGALALAAPGPGGARRFVPR